jgi:hypothetical protein
MFHKWKNSSRHKLKQEKKGAKKEIRKDVAFLAGVKVIFNSLFFLNNSLALNIMRPFAG